MGKHHRKNLQRKKKPGQRTKGFDFGVPLRTMIVGDYGFEPELRAAGIMGCAYGMQRDDRLGVVLPTISLVAENEMPVRAAFKRFKEWAATSDDDALELTIVLLNTGGYAPRRDAREHLRGEIHDFGAPGATFGVAAMTFGAVAATFGAAVARLCTAKTRNGNAAAGGAAAWREDRRPRRKGRRPSPPWCGAGRNARSTGRRRGVAGVLGGRGVRDARRWAGTLGEAPSLRRSLASPAEGGLHAPG